MRFVIVGAGRVGLRTARAIRESENEAVLVERTSQTAALARDEGFKVVEGDGSLEMSLEEADIESAPALGALTGDVNVNLAACAIADQHDCRTVMRIDEDYREELYRDNFEFVDVVVHPERLGAILAKNALVGGNSRAIADVERNLQIVEFTITEDAPMRGYTLSELELPDPSRLIAYGAVGGSLAIPTTDETLAPGDRLVVLADSSRLNDVRRIVVGETGRAIRGGA